MIEYLKKNVAVICVLYLCFCVTSQTEYIYESSDGDDGLETDQDPHVDVESVEMHHDGELKRVADAGGGIAGPKPAFGAVDNPGVQSGLNLAVENQNQGMQLSAGVSSKTQHIIIASVCAAVAVVGIMIAVTCYCKFRQSETANFAAQRHDNGYATYGVTGPVSKAGFHFHEPGDRKLAQSAQMYHYQYQKQQMIDMEKANGEVKADATDEDNEAEDEDDVVYQTCGLASSTDLQIPNPMFKGDENGDSKGSDEDNPSGKGQSNQ